jgi:hypothetical protein
MGEMKKVRHRFSSATHTQRRVADDGALRRPGAAAARARQRKKKTRVGWCWAKRLW